MSLDVPRAQGHIDDIKAKYGEISNAYRVRVLGEFRRSLRHLVNVVHDLTSRDVGLRVLTGKGAAIDTTTPAGKLVFGIFASLAEFERDSFPSAPAQVLHQHALGDVKEAVDQK